MAEGKNCPNCGAPLDMGVDKCAYCGTSYFDLTAIDWKEDEPVFLKLKMNGYTLTGKFRPYCGGITFNEDVVSAYGGAPHSPSTRLINVTRSRCMSLDINFEAVPDKNGNLFQITVNKN